MMDTATVKMVAASELTFSRPSDNTLLVRLAGDWTIGEPISSVEEVQKQVVTRQPSFSKPLADKSFETLVAAMSELVADLSREIAGQIKMASR